METFRKGGYFYFIAGISDDTLAAFEIGDDGIIYYFWGEWSSGDEWIDVNWIEDDYALAKNVGTKLYKHVITISTDLDLVFISNSSQQYTGNIGSTDLLQLLNDTALSFNLLNNGYPTALLKVEYAGVGNIFSYYDGTNIVNTQPLAGTVTDTVTEL